MKSIVNTVLFARMFYFVLLFWFWKYGSFVHGCTTEMLRDPVDAGAVKKYLSLYRNGTQLFAFHYKISHFLNFNAIISVIGVE